MLLKNQGKDVKNHGSLIKTCFLSLETVSYHPASFVFKTFFFLLYPTDQVPLIFYLVLRFCLIG